VSGSEGGEEVERRNAAAWPGEEGTIIESPHEVEKEGPRDRAILKGALREETKFA